MVKSVGSERSENFYEKSLLLQKSRDSHYCVEYINCRLQIVVEDGAAAVYH